MLQQDETPRRRCRGSLIVLDAILCENVGSFFGHMDHLDNSGDGPCPLAQHPGARFSVGSPGHFPMELRLHRRYEELTQWEAGAAKQFPDLERPTHKEAWNRLHQQVNPVLLQSLPAGRVSSTRCLPSLPPSASAIWRCDPFGCGMCQARSCRASLQW
jgi:hypothetical protein